METHNKYSLPDHVWITFINWLMSIDNMQVETVKAISDRIYNESKRQG